jgi:hypothetical protein
MSQTWRSSRIIESATISVKYQSLVDVDFQSCGHTRVLLLPYSMHGDDKISEAGWLVCQPESLPARLLWGYVARSP